jgi:hypothetical protein
MEIISGQQKMLLEEGNEFNLCPFGSSQFFQMLESR